MPVMVITLLVLMADRIARKVRGWMGKLKRREAKRRAVRKGKVGGNGILGDGIGLSNGLVGGNGLLRKDGSRGMSQAQGMRQGQGLRHKRRQTMYSKGNIGSF